MFVVPSGTAAIELLLHAVGICTPPHLHTPTSLCLEQRHVKKIVYSFVSGVEKTGGSGVRVGLPGGLLGTAWEVQNET
jgi:hypothetical protein